MSIHASLFALVLLAAGCGDAAGTVEGGCHVTTSSGMTCDETYAPLTLSESQELCSHANGMFTARCADGAVACCKANDDKSILFYYYTPSAQEMASCTVGTFTTSCKTSFDCGGVR